MGGCDGGDGVEGMGLWRVGEGGGLNFKIPAPYLEQTISIDLI